MELNPIVSVIIPHLNQHEGLEACLSSLDMQIFEYDYYEVIVVDNGSTPPPEAIVARHPNARLLHEAQPGPGPARNTGVIHARGIIFAFIDADCRAHPNWLATALLKLRLTPENTILGGDVRIWHDGKSRRSPVDAYECVFAYRFKLYIERHGFCGTGNLIVRRAAFEKIGPFAGIQYAEDMEWGTRALAAGFRFQYIPNMIVFHPARATLNELYEKWDRHTQHFLHFAVEKPAWKIRWGLRAALIFISPIVDSLRVLTSDRIHGLSDRSKAILVLCKIRAHRARTMFHLLRHTKDSIAWNRDITIQPGGLQE